MRVTVTVKVTEKQGYDYTDVASAMVETNAPWDEIKPTAIHSVLDSAVEDVLARVNRQLKQEHGKRLAAERESEIV